MNRHESFQELEEAIKIGEQRERARIIKFLEDEADKFDAMRPEWYKSVADKMDLRIRTIRAIAKKLKGEQDDNQETA